MTESSAGAGGPADRSRLVRLGVAALIIVVIGAIFVQREVLSDDDETVAQGGAVTELGILDDRSVSIGEPVPDFILQDLAGQTVRLSDFHGKTVVLNFWATWCPPCRAEMPDLQAAYDERLPAGDFVVLAVDKLVEDSAGAVTDFVDEFGLTFPVVLDGGDDVSRRFNVRGLPATFFIDRDGVLRAKNLGPVFGNLLPDGIAAADAAGARVGP